MTAIASQPRAWVRRWATTTAVRPSRRGLLIGGWSRSLGLVVAVGVLVLVVGCSHPGLPVIVAEVRERAAGGKDLENELLALAAANSETAQIRRVLFHPSLPTDIRHNAKIGREELAVWARRKLLRMQ